MFSLHGTHGWQVTEPVSFAKDPSGHALHAPMLALGANMPGLHGVCSVLPVGAKWPASVVVQSSALLRLVEVEYEPAAHGSAAAAPAAQ